jgi:hypothetical protein
MKILCCCWWVDAERIWTKTLITTKQSKPTYSAFVNAKDNPTREQSNGILNFAHTEEHRIPIGKWSQNAEELLSGIILWQMCLLQKQLHNINPLLHCWIATN